MNDLSYEIVSIPACSTVRKPSEERVYREGVNGCDTHQGTRWDAGVWLNYNRMAKRLVAAKLECPEVATSCWPEPRPTTVLGIVLDCVSTLYCTGRVL